MGKLLSTLRHCFGCCLERDCFEREEIIIKSDCFEREEININAFNNLEFDELKNSLKYYMIYRNGKNR